jgi:hypothetical protein
MSKQDSSAAEYPQAAMSSSVLGKRNRGSASPSPTGESSGQPEAKRSAVAHSPAEDQASIPVEIQEEEDEGPVLGAQVDEGEDSDDEVGPTLDAGPAEGNEKRRKRKAAGMLSIPTQVHYYQAEGLDHSLTP